MSSAKNYIYNFLNFANAYKDQWGGINHIALHNIGNDLVEKNLVDKAGIFNPIPLHRSGANSLIFKINNSYIKLSYARNIQTNKETEADKLVNESIVNTYFREYIPDYAEIVSGISGVWRLTKQNAITYTNKYNLSAKYNFYDIGIITEPIQHAYCLTSIVNHNQLHVVNNQFVAFIVKLMRIGYEHGFVHNDLHAGNILYDNDKKHFMLIDLGRAYFATTQHDAQFKNVYKNEYTKMITKQPFEPYTSLQARAETVPTLYDFVSKTAPYLISGNEYIKSMPLNDVFKSQTYILFDLITLYKKIGKMSKLENDITNLIRQNKLNVDHYEMLDNILNVLNKSKSKPITDINVFYNMVDQIVTELLKFWYVHYIYTCISYIIMNVQAGGRSVVIQDVDNYQNFLFQSPERGVWFRADIFHILVDSFYSLLYIPNAKGETPKQKIDDILVKITTLQLPQTAGKPKSKKKVANMTLNIPYDDYGDILLGIDDAKTQLKEEFEKKSSKILFDKMAGKYNVSIKPEPIINMTKNLQPQEAYGGNMKTHIIYNGKTRKVCIKNNRKYITVNKEEIYLNDIKGSYRYL